MCGVWRPSLFGRIALANLGSVYLERRQYALAERREAVQIDTEALSAVHLNTAIARIKLGRVLMREHKYREAEDHLMAGYKVLTKQARPSLVWILWVREDLADLCDALDQPGKANGFRVEVANAANRAP